MTAKRFSQTIRAPLGSVYRWCTDFSVDEVTGDQGVWYRRILEKTRARAVFVDVIDAASGHPKLAVNVVQLAPPDAWHLDLFGDPRNESVDYRLRRRGPDETRLDMVFRVGLGPTEGAGFTALWEGYAREIVHEYRSRRAAPRQR